MCAIPLRKLGRRSMSLSIIILGIEIASLLVKKVTQRADAAWAHNNPMALELLGRLRNFLTGWYKTKETRSDPDEAGSGPGPAGDQPQRNSRKRRIAEDEPPLIKYRRVDNSFPRFIPNEAAEETVFNTTVSRTEVVQRRFESCAFFKDSFAEDFKKKIERKHKELDHRRQLAILQAEESRETRKDFEHTKRFNDLMNGNPQQVIVTKFSLQITRSDIRTLLGSSWLNDEVINFYMNLLTERSELRSDELPSVYAMNTFFVPRLLRNGHGGVKRWTRKVDLFSKDIIPVPVHCNGVHWCMAIIHMRNKTIRYYDSMGKPNKDVLDALESYLRQESLDKRKQPFDTSDFRIESVLNVPQQTNGSDCGVFSCMFAEYISRDAPITFSQEHVEYFRKKMVLEIADGKLWK